MPSKKIQELLVETIHQEIQRTKGCTDPGSVCFAVSLAVKNLQCIPEQVHVTTSANLYKNAMGVGVPGTGQVGLPIAAALGVFIPHSEAELAILDYLEPAALEQAHNFLTEGRVKVDFTSSEGALYICARVKAGKDSASVVISGDYTHVVQIIRNGEQIFSSSGSVSSTASTFIHQLVYTEVYEAIITTPPEQYNFLVEAAKINFQAVKQAEKIPQLRFQKDCSNRLNQQGIYQQLQYNTGLACEARMSGAPVPIMALGGSGNQGITNFLGVLSVAKELGCSDQKLAVALALSAGTALFIKSFLNRVTAVCGSALAVGPGVAAGTVFLLDGDYEAVVHAIQSTLAALNGVLCEGANLLCPFKISAAAMLAINYANLACCGIFAPAGHGILETDIERTFANLGRVNQALNSADQLVLSILSARSQDHQAGQEYIPQMK